MENNDDEVARRRQALAAALRNNESVVVTPSGEVESVEEAENYINQIKKKHYDAKHNCFAYIIMEKNGDKVKKSSDDGEPSGTAGMPILEILEKQNLCNVLVVVTRYFGGILLGTGGLLRAYSGVTLEALKNVEIASKTLGFEVEIETNYKDLEQIKYNLEKEKIRITKINYGENVELVTEIQESLNDIILEKNKEKIIKYQIKTKKYVDI